MYLQIISIQVTFSRLILVETFCLWPSFLHRTSAPLYKPFSQKKPLFLRVCSTSSLKTLLERRNFFLTSNFSFSHSVFNSFETLSAVFIQFESVVCKLFQFGRVKNLSFGKGLSEMVYKMVCMGPLHCDDLLCIIYNGDA